MLRTKLLFTAILAVALSVPAFADTNTSYMFAFSDSNQGRSTPATITVTYNDNTTATVTTGSGFQYYNGFGGCINGTCYLNQGWWADGPTTNTQFFGTPNSNYQVGEFQSFNFRDFFTFDTAGLCKTYDSTGCTALLDTSGIKKATLTLDLYTTSATGNARLQLANPTASADQLNQTDCQGLDPTFGCGTTNLYNALQYINGTSTNYGSKVFNLTTATTPISLDLSADAITALAAAINGQGQTGSNANGDTTANATLFTLGGSLFDAPTTPTPEPASLLLIGTGLAGVFLRRRR